MLRKLLVLLSFILFSLISFHANAELILSCSTQTTVVTSKSQMVASPSQYVIFNNCKTPGYSTTTYGPYLLSGIDNMPGSTYVIKYAITNQCNEETGCQLFFELQPNPIQILSCGPNPQNLSCGSVPSPSNSDVVVNNPSILDYIVIEIEGPTLISCGEKYTVIYSAVDIYGYKDICSRTINVMCPCPEKWCTQTQETYGGNTNFVCSNNTQLQLIQDLSGHAIGRVAQNRSFTFHTWDFLCTHSILPGTDNYTILGPGNGGYNSSCIPSNMPLNANGNIQNKLAGATMALTMNLQLTYFVYTPAYDLKDLVLLSNCYTTVEPTTCTSFTPIPGTETLFCINSSVYNILPANPKVQDVLDLANDALAGLPVGVSLVDIYSSVNEINKSFEGCRILDTEGWESVPDMQEGEEEEETSSRSIKNNKLDVFPNPAKDIINIKLSLKETNSISVGLFDIGGRLIYEHKSNLNVHDQFSHKINVQGLDRGLYLVRIYTDKEQFARKISIH